MIDQVRSTLGEFARVSGAVQKLAPGRPAMTADDCYSFQFELESGAQGLIAAAMAMPGPLVMSTRIVGTEGGAWIQSGASFGEPEQVWVARGGEARQIETPADLINPPPEPFPIADLVQTEQDRWHSQGFDVAPYARLFKEMKARIEGRRIESRERAADFRDAAAGQAVLDAVRRSAAERRWVEVETV
jgi:predicted dehydrogenase